MNSSSHNFTFIILTCINFLFLQHGAPRAVQVERLLHFIQKRPTWHFHALLRACALTHQESVIHELGFDPEVYQEEDGSQLSSNSGDKVNLSGKLLRGKDISYYLYHPSFITISILLHVQKHL